VTDRAGERLSEFVFALAVPFLLFRTLVRAELPALQPWGYRIS
jgi:predicted permease